MWRSWAADFKSNHSFLPHTPLKKMARRLYLGRLPAEARQEDVEKLFDGYGRVVDCRVMAGKGFGFVEFEGTRDAEDAVAAFNGKPFMGTNIVVEFAKEARRRDNYDGDRGHGPPPRTRRPPGFRIIVSGVSRDTSWQDLKDFGREAGSVSFADIDRDVAGQGILEYLSKDDADSAVKLLDGKELRGASVRVALAEERAGGYERRSRSPRRGGDYDRRPRSPPRKDYDDRPRRDDRHDDRRYDDRRGGEPYDRRRDDDRVPSSKRKDEERYDDRRPANGGDGGWSRT
ncbi:RNA-binding domain-containing protein [Sistotremastrum suecicum HHB10207 ss-3]|uniref:RNA-binding domain-containing protein n=1 Tax=Sistotremastrum suecicum HHB10207 ss-3 TaxID=1314776 RepID=A0A166E568_9AGAM|nr:RNA-binding domain-containing protein [Sistotremastrum suecicum HHB10207 ss-3]